MMKKLLTFCIVLFLSVLTQAQTLVNSRLFAAYRHNKFTSILPDFSYVGYHRGDDPIPTVTHTVFNVTNYGAIANDNISDRPAIEAAIEAARLNGSGIVFFPPGRFRVNEDGDDSTNSIIIRGNNTVLRGSGSGPGGTELFMRRTMQPTDPNLMYSTIKLFSVYANTGGVIGNVNASASIGDFNITLTSKGNLQAGNRIVLEMLSTDPSILQYEIGNHTASSTWDVKTEGVKVKVYHQIKSISGNTLTLYEPLTYPINPAQTWAVSKSGEIKEVGFEDIAFVGNWKETFVHHRSWVDDSGWSILSFSRSFDCWVRNCRFTDVNVAAAAGSGANISFVDCEITGNGGHEAIFNAGATNVLISNVIDRASQWHSIGVNNITMNTVLHNVTYPSTTSFECHASQPRNTLLDNIEGGLLRTRAGGASQNLPHHLRNLLLWNYKQTNSSITNFKFWGPNPSFYIPYPIIAGITGGTTFDTSQLRDGYEGIGNLVYPSSLYEAQLQQRKAETPWPNSLNWRYTFGTQSGTFSNTGTIAVYSLSNSSNSGFLNVKSGTNMGVHIRGSGNALFELDGEHNLSFNIATSGTMARYSVNDINIATSVARFSYNIDFNSSGMADAGNYVYAVGNNKGKLFEPSHTGTVYRASDELFTALRFTPNTSATSTSIDLAYRLGSDASSTTTYTSINNTTFTKGGKYYVEVYCNNSGSSQTYKESTTNYVLPNNTFHIWVNGSKIGGNFPRSIEVNGSTGLSSGTSIALANGLALNSFLLLSNNGTSNSSSKVTLYYPAVSYLNTSSSSSSNTSIPVSLVSFDAYKIGDENQLSWSTASEINNKHFEVYRSINDGKSNLISKIDGAGNSLQKRYYHVTDKEPYTGIAYYSLQQVDQNGTTYNFNTLKAIKSDLSESKFIIYTPSDDFINGIYTSESGGNANFSVYDLGGKQIYNSKLILTAGTNKIQAYAPQIAKGVYVAVIHEGDKTKSTKFIK